MGSKDRKLFGTDGVRGVANVHPMTTDIAMQIGRAAAYIMKKADNRRHRIVIGKDTRLSGYMIENALASGICSMGVDVLLVGPLPTPGIAFITNSMRADAGVVISASHNPFQDNGIKIFNRDGYKLPDEVEAEIERLIDSNGIDSLRPTAEDVGKAFRLDDARGRYIVFLKHTFPRDYTLDGLKLVLDCANGAAYRCAPEVFEELGAEVHLIGVDPDGHNINRGCGSLHPSVAAEMVVKTGADLGLALDGDADRIIFIDHKGNVIDGDKIMAICARDLKGRNELSQNTVVATVMSNLGLHVALKKMGIDMVRTAVGDRYVVERMRADGYNFGGEQSGHMIFLDHNTTGDGILTALQVLAVMVREGRPLEELAGIMESFPQVLVNVRVSRRADLDSLPEFRTQCVKVQQALGDNGRLLVRFSGTEPVVRVMLEGEDEDRIRQLADETADCINAPWDNDRLLTSVSGGGIKMLLAMDVAIPIPLSAFFADRNWWGIGESDLKGILPRTSWGLPSATCLLPRVGLQGSRSGHRFLCRASHAQHPRMVFDPVCGDQSTLCGAGHRYRHAIHYDNPKEVGADRIVNAVAAYERHHTALIIVISARPPLSTTFPARGIHRRRHRSRFDHFQRGLVSEGQQTASGRNFCPAQIRLGQGYHQQHERRLIFGYTGLVDGLVERIQAEVDTNPKVVATGGLAPLIAGLSRTIEVVYGDLTLEGLRLIYERNRPQADRD